LNEAYKNDLQKTPEIKLGTPLPKPFNPP